MPLVDSRLKPGQWTQSRQGASGAHYDLRFQGSRFLALSRREQWPGIGKPWYWRRIYTAYANNRHPHGKMVLAAFEDLGIVGKLAVAKFIGGQHVRLTRVSLDGSYDSSEMSSDAEGVSIMAETVTVTEADLAAALRTMKDGDKPDGVDSAEGFATYLFNMLRRAPAPAGDLSVGGPDSGITADDSVDNTAANNG